MKSPRRSKSLEVLARSVKDSDQFVTHVCNVAAAYGKHHAPDHAASREVRQALRSLARHSTALLQWLQSAARGESSNIESQALRQIGVATRNPASFGQSVGMRAWLAQVAEASTMAADAASGESRQDALRAAAEGLRATFEHHGIKLSQRAPQQEQSDAVRLLCALVSSAGATEIEPAAARQWFTAPKPVKDAVVPAGQVRPVKASPAPQQKVTRKAGIAARDKAKQRRRK